MPQSPVVTLTGTGTGIVTSNPGGINCPTICSASFVPGTSVTLTAVALTGSAFNGWSGACSGTGACTITVSGSPAVAANFIPYVPKSTTGPILTVLTVTPSSYNFGTVQVGTTATVTVQLSNTGDAAAGNLVVASAASSSATYNVPATQFPISIAPGNSVPLTVTFTPPTAASTSATVSFASNASNPSATLSLSGTGATSVTSSRSLNISPTTLFFGNVSLGSSKSLTVTMSNPGSSNTTVYSATVSGSGYSVTSPTFQLVLAPGATQIVNIAFAPSAAGAVTGAVTFTSDAASTPFVSLIGSGDSGSPVTSATVLPAAIDFGTVPVASTYSATAIVYNTGNTALTINSAGPVGAGFAIDSAAYPVTIPVNGARAVTLSFAAAIAGTSSGTVTFFVNGTSTGNPVVNVTGTGGAATTHTATLTWNASTSAVLGYNVYRSTKAGTGYQKLVFTKLLSFTDSALANTTTYYYVVAAVDANGVESGYSNQVTASVP